MPCDSIPTGISRWPGSSPVPGWLGKRRLPAGVRIVARTSINPDNDCPAKPIAPRGVALAKLELSSEAATPTVEPIWRL